VERSQPIREIRGEERLPAALDFGQRPPPGLPDPLEAMGRLDFGSENFTPGRDQEEGLALRDRTIRERKDRRSGPERREDDVPCAELFGGFMQYQEDFNDPSLAEASDQFQEDQFGRRLFRSGNFLSAFAISFIPALISVSSLGMMFIAVLGPMRELGEHADQLHAGLAEPVLEAKVDRLILIGADMAPLEKALAGQIELDRVDSVDEASELLLAMLRPGDAVLVKASNSVGLAKLVDRVAGEPATCST